ncbi:MAG: CFI-box-CTERM domain-containing protein [Candidatus Nitrosopumilus sp. bin_68KS]
MAGKFLQSHSIILGIIIIFTVFTVTLTETIQIVEGLAAGGDKMIYKLQRGESQLLTWTLINDEDKKLDVEFYATGPGSELFVFEEYITMEPKSSEKFEILVVVPKDHEDNVEYHPKLFALTRGEKLENVGAGIVMNLQMQTNPIIKIGDNPIYTSPITEDSKKIPEARIVKEKTVEEKKEKVEEEKIETIEEKLARIQAANAANNIPEMQVYDTVEETFEKESVIDYDPEPIPDPEPIVEQVTKEENEGGGCLIATAAFGTELAPQVQILREIRDNTIMSTGVGKSFMTGFNTAYYSFSPTIADMERENPMFKEVVRVFITPMISTLSIMKLGEEGNDIQVFGLGISVIVLNLGLYVVAPIVTGYAVGKLKRK